MSFTRKVIIQGKNGSDVADIAIDSITHILSAIESEHGTIHDGKHFYINSYVTLNNGETLILALTTPASKKIHFVYEVASTGEIIIEFYEGSNISGGTSITPVNNNRNSSVVSEITVVKDPTVNSYGTKIGELKWGTSGTKFIPTIGGGFSRTNEVILKISTTYIVKISSGTDGNIINYIGSWYEWEDL